MHAVDNSLIVIPTRLGHRMHEVKAKFVASIFHDIWNLKKTHTHTPKMMKDLTQALEYILKFDILINRETTQKKNMSI